LADPVIGREIRGSKGRFVIRRDGEEADLTYSITGVPDSFRGTGAGLALDTRLVETARAEGFRVMPLCPFVNAQAKRHPEWTDAFAV
jgi:predicted GNAT family acetyltransferase